MAIKVPTYSTTRELPSAANALPSVRQTAAPTADQLGGNARVPTDYVGAGMKSAGADLMNVGLEMREQDDFTAVMHAETILKDRAREKSVEWQSRRGVNANGVTEEVAGWYRDEAVKAGEGLNDRQRRIFDQTTAKLRESSLNSVSVHEQRERESATVDAAQASIVGSVNFAVENANDPGASTIAQNDIIARVNAVGLTLGWSPERADYERRKHVSQLHAQVIGRIAVDSPERAEEYLAKHEQMMDPVAVTKLREGLKHTTATRRAQSFADDVVASGLSESEALARAREQFHGENEKAAVAEVKMRYQERRAATEQVQREARDTAWDAYAHGNSLGSVPTAVWEQMDGKDVVSLREYAAARAERIAKRNSRDPAVRAEVEEQERIGFERLRTMAEETPEEFAKVDLVAEGKHLSDADFRKLREVQQAIRGGKYVTTSDRAWSGAVKELGIGGSGSKAVKERTELRAAYDAALRSWRIAHEGKEPTEIDRAAIIDSLIVNGTVPGMLWGSNEERRYEAINAGRAEKWKPNADVGEDRAPQEFGTGSGRGPAQLPHPRTQADYDALPKGARYVHPRDGTVRVKP
ncbi:MAG: hypothetical protein KJ011_03280 [Burkholderiaceae bacterium]|nr:hypothetical protein [Burkholderiaceae bacterium]